MRKTNHYARSSALPAIAAALALSSTPLFAQEAQPVTEPVPQVTPPPPTMDAAPTPEAATPATDAAEPTTAAKPAVVAATPVKRATRTATAKPVATRSAPVRTANTQVPARPTAVGQSAAPMTAPVTEPAATPIAEPSPAPAAPATAQATPPAKNGSEVPVIAGGALALLALGGGAFAIARRRREEDENVWVDEQAMADDRAEFAEPVRDETVIEPIEHEQPKIVAPAASAFSWGNVQARPAASTSQPTQATADDDRMPGESWVDRAYRGPTPNNPSASLRNRLKRAAFFDKREREVAAGTAEPVDMGAGLPEAMIDERERELA